MPNDVLRAIDAVLVLGVEDTSSPEGKAADALVSQYDLSNVVGKLTNVSINVTSDVQPFYEIGQRYPTYLRPGILKVSGSAERAHVNGALLRLLLGDGAVSPPSGPTFVQPSFNLVSTLKDPAQPTQSTKVTVFGVKFDSWTYTIPSDTFVMEAVTFKAMRLAYEET
ncbi:MAG TPA: hypothetical protein VMH32_13195 [Burkholderiales bacterium]|nr:hypothetical protein [Burkholderiales bacterium]